MKKNRFPKGWDEARVQRVLKHYETQTDAEAAAEDDEIFKTRSTTVMRVPLKLVPQIRKLIAKHAG